MGEFLPQVGLVSATSWLGWARQGWARQGWAGLGWARLKKWILGDPRDPGIFGMACGWLTRAQLLVERKLFFPQKNYFFGPKCFWIFSLDIGFT